MTSLAEEFAKLDKDNHVRVQGAIKTAMAADFKSEDEPKHKQGEIFTKKPLEFFVRDKIDPSALKKATTPSLKIEVVPEEKNFKTEIEVDTNLEENQKQVNPQTNELDDLGMLPSDPGNIASEPTQDEPISDSTEENDSRPTEHYDEGFAAGRAAALSELEEQRIENLGVLKAISEKLLNDSVFNFDNVSMKVLETVNELSSERCGIAIDENPKHFLDRIALQIEQVRNLSEEKCVFFNEQDLAALSTFDEFEEYFAQAKVRVDPALKRGDVVVKVGGVELRDAPFADFNKGVEYE